VNETGEESYGLLCFAEIEEFSGKLDREIEKVELMDELPENWTYPLIQSKLIEKYLQAEMKSYVQIQQAAKQAIDYIKNIIKPGLNLLEIRRLCEEKLRSQVQILFGIGVLEHLYLRGMRRQFLYPVNSM
jgi:hypothetical protein